MRIYLALALGLALLATAHSAAAARGMRDAAGQMVICTGTGPVTVYIDSQGRPAKAPHDCPDCVMQALFAPAAPGGLLGREAASGRAALPARAPLRAMRAHGRATARAPPHAL